MKLQISDSAADSLVRPAIVARVVAGAVVDMPELMNSGWLSILLGGILTAPLYLFISRMKKLSRNVSLSCGACLLFFAISIFDAAAVAAIIADSASTMALNSTAAVYLMLPLAILCLGCLRLGGDALGASAGIWNRFLPALLAIVLILQARHYQPEWLTPLLGPGLPSIFAGALKAAGWFALPAPLFLIAEPDVKGPERKLHPLRTLLICTCFAAGIGVIFSMMTPVLQDENLGVRTFRLSLLLANGRSGLALQLPSIALWYPGLFYALLMGVFTGAVMLQKALPGWSPRACIWTAMLSAAIIAASHFSGRNTATAAAGWLYAAIIAAIALGYLPPILKKEKEIHA